MDNISDLLAKKGFNEPAEIKLIKNYVKTNYDEDINVKVDMNKIFIYVKNSALANSIRMNIPEIQKICKTDKRIVIYLNN